MVVVGKYVFENVFELDVVFEQARSCEICYRVGQILHVSSRLECRGNIHFNGSGFLVCLINKGHTVST
jgi:hypothetical protein